MKREQTGGLIRTYRSRHLVYNCLGTDKDLAKIEFTKKALAWPDPFAGDPSVNKDVQAAIQWIGARSGEQEMLDREAIITQIEIQALEFKCSGETERFLDGCDDHIKQIAGSVNGPLMKHLAGIAGHDDTECVSLFTGGEDLCCIFFRMPFCARRATVWRAATMRSGASLRGRAHAAERRIEK